MLYKYLLRNLIKTPFKKLFSITCFRDFGKMAAEQRTKTLEQFKGTGGKAESQKERDQGVFLCLTKN